MNDNLILQNSLYKLFDKGSSVLFHWKNDAFWSIEYVSQNVSNLLGYSSEEFLQGSITYAECIHPDFLAQVQQEVLSESQSGTDFFEHKPYKIITKEQQEKWVLDQTIIEKDENGHTIGFVGYINDITKSMELRDENELLQQRVQLAVESTNDGIWDWDLLSNEVYFSPHWKNMLGYRDEEIENKAEVFFELIHPDDKEKTHHILEQHLKNKRPYMVELRLLCKDGSYKWILSRGKAIFDADKNPLRILGSHIDISQQKEIERRLQAFMDNSSDGIFIMDENFNLIDYSNVAKEMLGYEDAEMRKLHVLDWDIQINAAQLPTIKEKLSLKPTTFETLYKRKDSTTFDASITATLMEIDGKKYTYASVRDMSEVKKLQETILHEKNFIETIIESANAVVAIIDREGTMIKLNSYGQNFSGYTQEEISQEPYKWSSLLPENVRDNVVNIVEKAKEGSIVKSYQNEWISKSGEHRMFEWSNTLVTKEDGSMEYISTIGIDITQNEKQKAFLQLLINSQSNMMALADNNELLYVNQAVLDFYAVETLEEMKSKHLCFCNTFIKTDYSFYIGKVQRSGEWISKIQLLPAEKQIVSIFSIKTQSIKTFRVNIEKYDESTSYLITFIDISETIQKQRELEYKSSHDPLTKAYNRAYFYEHYQTTIAHHTNIKKLLGVALIDIDHFKEVNDTYGHDIGDKILKLLVRTIWENTRESDTLIRWGGEEFILLMPTRDKESLHKTLDTLRLEIEKTIMPGAGNITVSMGASLFDGRRDIEESIKDADLSLYNSKNNGRNRVTIF